MANDNQVQTVTITASLGNAILSHLKTGGTRLEADMLAEHLVNQSNAPAAEAARQKELMDAVAASRIDTALKAGKVPVADPIVEAVIPEPARASVPRRGKK